MATTATADQGTDRSAADEPRGEIPHHVDVSGVAGVQVGQYNTQIIYTYDRRTWTTSVAPPPLVDVAGVVDSPYRGLGAFEERDAGFFFGREDTATDVLERMSSHLATPSLLAVSGVSGVGKSSLLRAGVLPRIRGAGLANAPGSESWPCLVLTPGRAPLDQLAVGVASLAGSDAASVRQALGRDPAHFALTASQATGQPRGSRRLLLFVDQFEQLFTQCPDESQRQAFVTALHAAATAGQGDDQLPAALVVLVVRADFEARCADYPELTAAIQDRYLVTTMTELQLRMAVTEPAKQTDSQVDADLVEILLDEVRTRAGRFAGAGVLPLLSHALDQAWRSRNGTALTITDYARTGGVERAVADSAERAYDRLSATQRVAARHVFIRLTATSEEGADTADRATRSELMQGRTADQVGDVEAVLEAFAAERLLTLGADSVEIAHEVLLSAWPLLRDAWLAETHGDRLVRTRLRATVTEWVPHRDPSYLYTGSLLETANGAASRAADDHARQPPLSHDEQAFLDASGRAQRRRVRRRHGFTAFLLVLIIGLGTVAVVAYRAQQNANQQWDTAVAGQLISESENLGDTDPTGAAVKSLAAWEISPSADARYAMLEAAAHPSIALFSSQADSGPMGAVALSHDGTTIATADSNEVRLWKVATKRQIGRPLMTLGVASAAFSPDDRTLATSGNDGTIRLWNVTTGQQIAEPVDERSGGGEDIAFSPDGRILAFTSDSNSTVRMWDTATDRAIGQPLQIQDASSVEFSPNGQILAVGADGAVQLWNVATGERNGPSLGDAVSDGSVSLGSFGFGTDGKSLTAVDLGDQTMLRVWDVTTGQLIRQTPVAIPSGDKVALSPDGRILADAGTHGTVGLWNTLTGVETGRFAGHSDTVDSLTFSSDGKTVVTGDADGTVQFWDVTRGQEVGSPLASSPGTDYSAAFSSNGKMLAAGGEDGTTMLWNILTGQEIGAPLVDSEGDIGSVVFSPNSKTLVTGDVEGIARLWDVATGREVGELLPSASDALNKGIEVAVFSPDGRILATGSDDTSVRLWDVVSGREIGQPLMGNASAIDAMAFSPDGKVLATASDVAVRLWNVANGVQIEEFSGYTYGVAAVAFSADGKTLMTAGKDDAVKLWDLATGNSVGQPITVPNGFVQSVAFSPDGRTLAIGDRLNTVNLWDLATGRLIGQPLVDPSGTAVDTVIFSPDGRTLATSGDDGTVRLWNVSYLVDLQSTLCAKIDRSLTAGLWSQYVPQGMRYRNVCR